jgi:hypothetical protein
MAIGTQKSKVVECVVVMIAIDVVQFQWDRLARPSFEAARRTPSFEDPFVDESSAQPIGLNWVLV